MAFQPVPNTALIEWVYTCQGQICENTYHARGDAPLVYADLFELATECYEWWDNELSETISSDCTLLRVECKALDVDLAPFAVYSPVSLASGEAGIASTEMNVSFVVKHTSGLTGRSGRGRWYIVGIPDTLVTASNLSSAQAALYASYFGTLDAAIAALGLTPVIVSRRHNNLPRVTGVTIPIVAHDYTDTVVDSQRRRLPGRGT